MPGSAAAPSLLVVVFDLDGTLLDLKVDIEAARAALSQHFQPLGFSLPFRPILSRMREAAAVAAGEGGDPAPFYRQALDILDTFEVQAQSIARPGALELLRALAAHHIPVGIVTDNGARCVRPALVSAGLPEDAVQVVVARDHVQRTKPDPEGLLQALSQLPPGQHVWYFGDRVRDIQAARSAALHGPALQVGALAHGTEDRSLLDAAGPDALLPGLSEVLTLPGFEFLSSARRN